MHRGEEIDFQDFDVSHEADGEEAFLRPVRRGKYSHVGKNGAAAGCVFEDPDEKSWISSVAGHEEINLMPLVGRMLDLLELERTLLFGTFCLAWLRDTLDSAIDRKGGFLFPRLATAATENSEAFGKFQLAMNGNKIASQGLQDLTKAA